MYRDRKGSQIPLPRGVIPGKRQSAYGIYIEKGKALLVQPSWSNLYEFPGGKIEKGETPRLAAKREFLEETGFIVDVMQKKPIAKKQTKFYSDDTGHFFDSTMYFFLIKKLGIQDESLIRKDEVAKLKWYPISKLNNSNVHETHLEVLKDSLG